MTNWSVLSTQFSLSRCICRDPGGGQGRGEGGGRRGGGQGGRPGEVHQGRQPAEAQLSPEEGHGAPGLHLLVSQQDHGQLQPGPRQGRLHPPGRDGFHSDGESLPHDQVSHNIDPFPSTQISSVGPDDGGNYTCAPPNIHPHSVIISIMDTEGKYAAVYRDGNTATRGTGGMLLTMFAVLKFC